MFGMQPYNYESFDRRLLVSNLARKCFGGPQPGEKAPDYRLRSLDGEKFRLRDFQGHKNVLLVFGSATCPMTAGCMEGLNDLHEEFGDEVQFFFIYVREAHPGDKLPAHQSMNEKIAAAELLRAEDEIDFPVLVDELDGAVHRDYGARPNPAFLIDKSGRVAFRALWAQPKVLREALQELLNIQEHRGCDRAIVRDGEDRSIAVRHGLMHAHRALQRGGTKSVRDFRRAAGPGARVLVAAGRAAGPIMHPGKLLVGAGLVLGVAGAGVVGGIVLRKRRLDRMRQPYYFPRRTRFQKPSGYEAVGI
jgi:hypothetical protein